MLLLLEWKCLLMLSCLPHCILHVWEANNLSFKFIGIKVRKNNIHQVIYKPDIDDKILDFEPDDIIAGDFWGFWNGGKHILPVGGM